MVRRGARVVPSSVLLQYSTGSFNLFSAAGGEHLRPIIVLMRFSIFANYLVVAAWIPRQTEAIRRRRRIRRPDP